MSWHFSQALVAAYSAASSLAGERYAPWNSTPFAPDDSCSDKMRGTCHRSQFGTMYVLFTDANGADLLTWYQAGFLAKISAQPEKVQGLTVSEAAYGEKWQGSFARYSRDTSSWKTHQSLLLGDWEPFSETWPRWGMMHGGECFQLPTLEHCTSVSGFGYLPTPRRSGQSRAFKAYRRENYQGNLEEFLGENGYEGWMNPQFSETVMEWPVGWTGIVPLGTGSIRRWLNSHGKV